MIDKKKSANTINLRIPVIRSFFDYLVADGSIDPNPASTKLVSTPLVPTNPSGRALTPKEVGYLLAGPDRSTPEGARNYALMLLMLRLSLRVAESCLSRKSDIRWSHGRWVLTLKVKRGREEKWPIFDSAGAQDHQAMGRIGGAGRSLTA